MKPGSGIHNIRSHSIAATWSQTLPNFKGPRKGNLAVRPEKRRETWILAHHPLPSRAINMGAK